MAPPTVRPGPIPDPLYDPALEAHVPEMERMAAMVAAMQGDAPEVWTADAVAAARRAMDAYVSDDPDVTRRFVDREIAGRHGPIRLRVHVPDVAVRAVVLHLHGGGFFVGRPEMDDRFNLRHAAATGTVTVAASYGLGPEQPYPAGPDDAETALVWLLEHAEAEWGVPLRVVAGASAGANLAAVALQRLRDRHDALGEIHAANLIYGVFDMRGTPSQYQRGIPTFRDLYLPDVARPDRDDPEYSPLLGDLEGMPPALFTVGTADYLFDDSLFMAARWHAAGSEATVRAWPGCPHGFNAYPAELARLADVAIDEWVGGVLDRVGSGPTVGNL